MMAKMNLPKEVLLNHTALPALSTVKCQSEILGKKAPATPNWLNLSESGPAVNHFLALSETVHTTSQSHRKTIVARL